VATLISDTIRRFGMWGLLVLAMAPSIQSGAGPHFALPIGIVCGLLAIVCSVELGFVGVWWLLSAVVMAIVFASITGYLYGKLLNTVKGSEMIVSTYTGFSFTYLFCIIWMALPFRNHTMSRMLGSGLRSFVNLSSVGGTQIISNFLSFEVLRICDTSGNTSTLWIPDASKSAEILEGLDVTIVTRFTFPTGMLLVFAACCFFVWLFFRTKTGIAISAAGMNPLFAKASGLCIDRGRVIANIISTVFAAIGIIIYSQSFGFAVLYDGPLMMAFQAVAAILIGGATAHRSKIFHVVIGTLIFQGVLTNVPPVFNNAFPNTDLSETIRMVVQNGIILFALTRVKVGRNH